MNLPFKKYILNQAERIIAGERSSNAKCFASKEDVPNVKEFAQSIADTGLYVLVTKTNITLPYEEQIYCFVISKNVIDFCDKNPFYKL